MKILHVSRQFYPVAGGTETYILNLCEGLIKKGIRSDVLCLDYSIYDKKQRFPAKEVFKGINIYRVHAIGSYKKPIPLSIPVKLFNSYDIIHLHDIRLFFETSCVLKLFMRYKLIISTCGLFFHTDWFEKAKEIAMSVYYKNILNIFFDAVICIGERDFHTMQKFRVKKLRYIDAGVKIDKYRLSAADTTDKTNKIFYFGRIDFNKGLELLFKSLAQINDAKWELIIAGRALDECKKMLDALAARLGITESIKWLGRVTDNDIADLINGSRFCVMPSTFESFGITVLEAMSVGAVCIANKIQAYEVFIENGKDGYLTDFSDTAQTAELLRKILVMPHPKLKLIGENAKLKAMKYDCNLRTDEIINLYNEVLHGKAA